MKVVKLVVMVALAALLVACGGGAPGSTDGANTVPPQARDSRAISYEELRLEGSGSYVYRFTDRGAVCYVYRSYGISCVRDE